MDDEQEEAIARLVGREATHIFPTYKNADQKEEDDNQSSQKERALLPSWQWADLEPVPDRFESVEHYKTIFTKLIAREMHSQIQNELASGETAGTNPPTTQSQTQQEATNSTWTPIPCLLETLNSVNQELELSRLTVRLQDQPRLDKECSSLRANMITVISTSSDTVERAGRGRKYILGLIIGVMDGLVDIFVNQHLCNQNCTREDTNHSKAGSQKQMLYVWPVTNVISSLRELQAVVSLSRNVAKEIVESIVFATMPQIPNSAGNRDKIISPEYSNYMDRAFNDAQRHAIAESARRRGIVLVQGPPGTGKTATILGCLNTLHVEAYGIFHEKMLHGEPQNREANTAKPTKADREPPKKRSRGGVSDVLAVWQSSTAQHSEASSILDRVLKATNLREAKCNSVLSWLSSTSSNEVEVLSGALGMLGLKPRILVAAPSNAAVDNVIEKVLQTGFRDGKLGRYGPSIIRVGKSYSSFVQQTGVSLTQQVDDLMQLSEYHVIDWSEKLKHDADVIIHELKRIRQEYSLSNSEGSPPEQVIGTLVTLLKNFQKVFLQYRRLKWLKCLFSMENESYKNQKMHTRESLTSSLLDESEIVCSTLSSSALRCVEDFTREYGRKFDTVIVDEAAQAIEASTLIPLKYHCQKFVLVGDPQQLPATVISHECKDMKLDQSLFARLVRCGYPSYLLDVQYRMHPEIAEFPSKHFYNGRIKDASHLRDGARFQAFHNEAYFKPLAFFDVNSDEGMNDKRSICNIGEANLAVQLIFALMMWTYTPENGKEIAFTGTIGVVSPYRGQVALLRTLYEKAVAQYNAEERFKSSKRIFPTCAVRIDTVDSFQGQECDVIILSLARSQRQNAAAVIQTTVENSEDIEPQRDSADITAGSIGFLRDIRRMNVALTRAKFALWVLGNAQLLSGNKDWECFIEHVRSRQHLFQAKDVIFPQLKKQETPTEVPPQSQPGYPDAISTTAYQSTVISQSQ